MKKKKTLLVVSPKGVPVKAFNVNIVLILLIVIFVGFGLLGYFIPYQKFTLNKIEINQKKNMTEQNKALLYNIKSTISLLNNLKEQISKLEEKKKSVLQFGIIGKDTTVIIKKTANFADMSTKDLLAYISSQEIYIRKFVQHVKKDGNLFDEIPVIRPVQKGSSVSRKFGSALDPFTGKKKFHNGIDLIGEKGIAVVTAASGSVEHTEKDPVWGYRVVVDHGNGYKTVYAHLGELKVRSGQHLGKGDLLGFIGLSGLSSGPHVHYELKYKNTYMDPFSYFFPVSLF